MLKALKNAKALKNMIKNAKALINMIKSKMKSVKKEKWKNKALHGQYPKLLEKPHVDIVWKEKQGGYW